jgi:hypothetical protein
VSRSAACTRAAPILALTAALSIFLAGPAPAAHWPMAGRDEQRTGLQPPDAVARPFDHWSRGLTGSDERERNVAGPPVITGGGPPQRQRVVSVSSGTTHAADWLNLSVLASRERVATVQIDDRSPDEDTAVGIAPVDTSTEQELGQILLVHNDDGASPDADVAIAQVDATTGEHVRDHPVPGTRGSAIWSPPVLTAARADGSRVLFFVASREDESRVFRVVLSDARERRLAVASVSATPDVDATPTSGPTVAQLAPPGGAGAPHVAVGTLDGGVRTFDARTLREGPRRLGHLDLVSATRATTARTPLALPSSRGAAGRDLFAIATTERDSGLHVERATRVERLRVAGDGSLVLAARSETLDGVAGPGLAAAGRPGEAAAQILVPTSRNLFLLRASDLSTVSRASETGLAPNQGFANNVPAVSGALAFVRSDGGRRAYALRLPELRPLPDDEFPVWERASGDARGQPAVSNGFVVFTADDGVELFRERDVTPPTVRIVRPRAGSVVHGTLAAEAHASDARTVSTVRYRLDGAPIGHEDTNERWTYFAGPGTFVSRARIDVRSRGPGTHVLRAVARDRENESVSDPRRILIGHATPVKLVGLRVRTRGRRVTVTGRLTTRIPRRPSRRECRRGGRVLARLVAGGRARGARRVGIDRRCRFRARLVLPRRRAARPKLRLRFLGSFFFAPSATRVLGTA